MTILQFIFLNIGVQQDLVIKQGIYVGSSQQENLIRDLYYYEDFYVEFYHYVSWPAVSSTRCFPFRNQACHQSQYPSQYTRRTQKPFPSSHQEQLPYAEVLW